MMDIVSRLDPLLEDARSDKIKSREAALKDLLALFRDSRRVKELVEAGQDDPNVLSDLLRAVFRCVDEEKKALGKKETAVALRRLSDATALVRTVATHIAAHLNRRHAADLLRHALNVLEHKGALYEPAALDYLKTLKCLFGHQHHLDNLDAREWEGLVCTLTRAAFDEDLVGHGAEVLDERFTSKEARGADLVEALGGGEDAKGHGKAKLKGRRMIVDSDDDDDDDQADAGAPSTFASTSRKRSRPPPSTPGPYQRPSQSTRAPATQLFSAATASKGLGAGQQRSISHTQIAIFSLLLTLLQQPHNRPLLGDSIVPPTLPAADGSAVPAPFPESHVALALLYKLLRFLLFYPETTSHLSVLKSTNLVLGVVQLNKLRPVALLADRLLPTLLRLWRTTKSRDVKEQVLIGLKLVFPFVARDLPADFGGKAGKNDALGAGEGDLGAAEKLDRLKEALDEEVHNRWAVEPLLLDSVRLEDGPHGQQKAFVAQSFKFGPKFGASQALAWAALELHADVYAAVDEVRQGGDLQAYASTPRSHGKRRKVDDALDGLLDAIDMSAASAAKVARLQVLLFLISRHGGQLEDRLKDILTALLGAVSHGDSLVQSWAFMCLSALARVQQAELAAGSRAPTLPTPFASPAKSTGSSDLADLWEQAWNYAVRRLAVPSVCRAASHAARAIGSHDLVPVIRLQTDIESCLANLEVQGPSFPYDSVCAFLVFALKVTCQNVRLFRLDLEDRVLGWLVGTWSVLDGTSKGFNLHSQLESHSPDDVLGLLAAVSRFKHRPGLLCEDPLPEAAVVDHAADAAASTVLRDFVLHHRVHEPPRQDSSSVPAAPAADRPDDGLDSPAPQTSVDLKDLTGRPRRASDFLLKSVEAMVTEWEGPDALAVVTPDKVRRSFDLVVLVLAYAGSLELNGVSSSRKLVKRACALGLVILPALSGGRLRLADMAVAVKGLEALVARGQEVGTTEATFLSPGLMTGIRRDLLPDTSSGGEHCAATAASARRQLLQVIWQGSDIQDFFAKAVGSLRGILLAAVGIRDDDGDSAMDVDVDETMVSFGVQESLDFVPMASLDQSNGSDAGLYFPSRSAEWLVLTCCSTVTHGLALQSGSAEPSRQRDLFNVLADCDCPQFIALGSAVTTAVEDGHLHISVAGADDILEGFQHFIGGYEYRRNELLHALAMRFLRATAELWLEASARRTDFGLHARTLVEYLAKQLATGRIRSPSLRCDLLRFLEAYLGLDPGEQVWALLDGDVASSAVGLFHSALRDVDVRVRYTAATILPRLYETVAQLVAQPFRDYQHAYLETTVKGYEQGLTNTVFFTNVLVRSTILRRTVYYHLLSPGQGVTSLPHLQAAIQAGARALGFVSPFELWKVYASTVVVQSLQSAPGSEWRPANSLIGAASQQENARSQLRDLGHLLIGRKQHARFDDLMLASGLPRADVMAESAPRALSGLLCNALREPVRGVDPTGDIEDYLTAAGCATSVRDLAAANADVILAQAFSELLNPQEIHDDLTQDDEHLAVQAAFRELARPVPELYRWDSLLLPRSTALAIYGLHEWVLKATKLDPAAAPSTAFNVLHQLFSRVGRSPLLIEQMRGVYSIAFFVACHRSAFRSPALLRTLLHLALVLMDEDELAPLVDSLLLWALDRLGRLASEGDDPDGSGGNPALQGLVELLLRVARAASRLEALTDRPKLSQVGYALLLKAEELVVSLRSSPTESRTSVAECVVALWPRSFYSQDLAAAKDSAGVASLSNILQDRSLSTSKFALVSRLQQLVPQLDADTRDELSSNWVWQLKQSLPSPAELPAHPALVRGFLEILQSTRMQAPSLLAIDQLPQQRKLEWDRHWPGVEDAAKSQIILILVEQLHSGDVDVIDTCYHVLQGVVVASHKLITSAAFRGALAKAPDVKELLDLLGQPTVAPHGVSSLPLADVHTQVPVTSARDHERWLTKLASFLSQVLVSRDALFGHLRSLLARNAAFAAQALPLLVQALLAADQTAVGAESSKEILSTYLAAVLRTPAAGAPVKQAIIDVVLHLRQIEVKADASKPGSDPLAHERWLNHEYLLLSRAAVEYKAYTTGLLFLELQHQTTGAAAASEEATQVLFSIYANIEDPDGFYGVKSTDWRSSLVQKLHHEDRWAQAFAFHGADYRYAPTASSIEGVYRSLHAFGFNKMALTLAQSGGDSSLGSGADVADDLGYDLAWRTETWDIPVDRPLSSPSTASTPPSSNALLYAALRAVHNERSASVVKGIVADAVQAEVSKMRSLGIESMSELRVAQVTLVCLREIQQWLELDAGAGLAADQWNDALPWFGDDHDFADLEKLVSVRSSLLQTVASRKTSIVVEDNPVVRGVQTELQLKLSARARQSDQLQAAINAASMAQKLDDPDDPRVGVLHEYANVLWKAEEHGMAIDIQRRLLDDPSLVSTDDAAKLQRARHLSVLGDWMSTSRLDTAARTESEYFAPAVRLIKALPADKAHGLVYHRFAIFAESQFRKLEKSPEIQRLRLYNDRQKHELSQLVQSNGKPRTNLPRDSTGSSRFDKVTQLQQDDAEKIRAHEETLQALLRTAIDMFGHALAVSDDFDDSLLRLASLWMSHHAREDLHAGVRATIGAVPSHKFIRIVIQLSARLEDTTNPFQLILHALFERLVAEHPFHCLYQLLTLRGFGLSQRNDGDRRRSSSGRGSSSSVKGKDDGPRTSRSFAAEKILNKSAKRSATAARRIRDVDTFCQAAIEWAWLPPDQPKAAAAGKRPPALVMDKNLKIAEIRDLAIPIPTAPLAIDRTCKYGSGTIVTVGHFQRQWVRAGGIHVPKITTCFGDDGKPYKQLYKSDDDIRQDAVMEQLFGIVNDLLARDPKTRSRHLRMITYKVVPLGDLTGFIEFVTDTLPIDSFLRKAHARYHPDDPSLSDMRKKVAEWQAAYKPDKIGRKFADAASQIHPVMRHFFTEKHKTPLAWYTMRLQYARSAATSSMVGHAVGLGDRHCSNILIHEKTGELIHIDHGVAFDGGRRLRIPELVPFRLTADIVDGLGMSGVEGVFRRCSEETMRVMRDSVETIMTVLEVCKHDPMHNWGIDADKLARVQGNADIADNPDLIRDSTDEDADRALTSVRSKLSTALSVEYTVNDLIQQARDPANLGSIFVGWQPWL